ncbi:MAG: glycyl-radical enzyme activating protein [Bacteroidota bacterium]|nr:glycyl-radical enzyme activating protein [Bacteroidota bacterium]
MNNALIFDIRRFSVHDGPGIRTTIFFKGCPLHCLWCHNPESQSNKPENTVRKIALDRKRYNVLEITGEWMTVEEVIHRSMEDVLFYEESGGGVTLSGGEPMEQIQFLVELLQKLKEQAIHTAIDTCGFTSRENLKKILPYTDLFLYDLKLMDEAKHIKYTGVSNKKILENLIFLSRQKKKIIIRFPVIPDITDTEKNVTAMIRFIGEMPVRIKEIDLLPYHSIGKQKYARLHKPFQLSGLPDMKKNELLDMKKRFESTGLFVKIGG